MKLDEKTVADLARQLGVGQGKESAIKRALKAKDGGDEKLVEEILKVKDELLGSNVPKEKQIEAINSLMPLMNKEQKTRLVKLIELLES